MIQTLKEHLRKLSQIISMVKSFMMIIRNSLEMMQFIDMPTITVKVDGLDKRLSTFAQYKYCIADILAHAREESVKRVILPTEELQCYPQASQANRPPYPYYILGMARLGYEVGALWVKMGGRDTSIKNIFGNNPCYAR